MLLSDALPRRLFSKPLLEHFGVDAWTCIQIYEGTAAAYSALEHQLQGAGPYLFGEKPCSLDAALLAQLAFHKHCPASAPELRAQVCHGLMKLPVPSCPMRFSKASQPILSHPIKVFPSFPKLPLHQFSRLTGPVLSAVAQAPPWFSWLCIWRLPEPMTMCDMRNLSQTELVYVI